MVFDALSASELEKVTCPSSKNGEGTLDRVFLSLEATLKFGCIEDAFEADLGVFDLLPLEIIQRLLAQFDLRSFVNFQYLNRKSRVVAESVPEYKIIAQYAANTLRAIITVGLGQRITCEMLYDKLCTEKCETCGDFGGYLYLLTCQRVCYTCFVDQKKFLPLRRTHATRKFGLDRQTLNDLPQMRSVPGRYSTKESNISDRILLIDHEAAHAAGIALYGSSTIMDVYIAAVLARKQREYAKRAIKRCGARPPETEDPRDGHRENPLRFMAVVRAPVFIRVSQKVEWGFHCCGCTDLHDGLYLYKGQEVENKHFINSKRLFTVSSFHEHVRKCGKITPYYKYFHLSSIHKLSKGERL